MKILIPLLLATLAPTLAFSAGSPGVEHNTQVFLESIEKSGAKPFETLTPVEARAAFAKLQAAPHVTLPPADVSEKTIQVHGKSIVLNIVRPKGSKGRLPAFIFIHGGGWVLGDFPTHERLVRDLVVGSGAAAVFVNYTPSPEARYPVAINEIYDATRWVAEHGAEINVDSSRLAIAGNSVGGNMAAVVSIMAKERGAPALKGQLLLWPVTSSSFDFPAFKEFATGHYLTTSAMRWFLDQYTTDSRERLEPYLSPLNASLDQLKDLPPALLIVGEKDPLRDEVLAYARKLDKAGTVVTSVRYDGMIHDFGMLNALADIPAVRASIAQSAAQLRLWLK